MRRVVDSMLRRAGYEVLLAGSGAEALTLFDAHAGAIRVLAVASATRAARLPNLPTLAEAGVPGVEADAWFALFAPAQTPATVVERLYRAVAAGLTTDAATKAIAAQGMTLALRTPTELAAWLPGM